METVSAILPCYNHEKFLQERISSVCSQTRAVDEIIFMDDCSTDSSYSIARHELSKAGHCPVKILRNESNSGSPFAQWNKGIASCTGDWIWIAETDDSCHPTFLQRLLGKALSDKAGLAYCQSSYIDEAGNCIGSALPYTDRPFPGLCAHDFSAQGSQLIAPYMIRMNIIPNASGVIFRRDLAIAVGEANTSMKYAGDWDFWIRFLAHAKVSFLSEELNYFRKHPATTRSVGQTQRVRAEYLACRSLALSIYLGSKGKTQLSKKYIGVKDLIIFASLMPRASRDFMHRVHGIRSHRQLREEQSKMTNIIRLSPSAWIAIGAYTVLERVRTLLSTMPALLLGR